MNTTTQAIAHEAEVQRQHVRLQLPISMVIRDRTVEVIDWSNSGAAFDATPLKAANIVLKSGDVFDTKLEFDFQTFSLSVPLSCEVRHVNSDGSRVGCRYHDMNERNISIMQYLVSAYISGDLVQVGDMLDVVSRKNFTTPRKVPAANLSGAGKAKRSARNFFYSFLMLLITVGLLIYAATSIFERMYIIEATSATVSLAQIDNQPNVTVVEAVMKHDDAVRLAKGMNVALSFPGYEQYFNGTIYDISVDDVDSHAARLLIVPANELPSELDRSPVDVKVNVF